MRGIRALSYSQVLIIPTRHFSEFSSIILHVKFHDFVFEVLKPYLNPKNSTAPLRVQLSALPTDSNAVGPVVLQTHALLKIRE